MNQSHSAIEPLAPIVVTGSGRSGTTWLLDLLAHDRTIRPIFEPLHFKNVPRTRQLWGLYLRANEAHEELESFLHKVFYHRADRAWFSWMTCRVDWDTPLWKLPRAYRTGLKYWRPHASRRAIKFIKASLMLPWMQQRFPSKMIYITRHPCAVLSSRKEMGWGGNPLRFLEQQHLAEDFLSEHRSWIEQAEDSLFKKLVLVWCIENLVPQAQIQSGELDVHWATYEDLVLKTEETLHRMLEFIDFPMANRDAVVSHAAASLGTAKEERLSKWKAHLDSEQVGFIMESTERFGLKF
jgi:hypothetical protein